jgi:hypothetical protein
MAIRTVTATRYVTPLREGGSVPGIFEADDDGLYVVKFRGAAQGPKALIAELLAGEIGRALGLPVPDLVFVDLDRSLARSEPDREIQPVLEASAGLNIGLDYLPGSITYDVVADRNLDPLLASSVVWFDSYVTNVDRTPRNPNLLMWHKRLWLIDHGAALYFHHTWADWEAKACLPFTAIKSHVLLPQARALAAAAATLAPRLTPAVLAEIVAAIPDDWLLMEKSFADAAAGRAAYLAYLVARLEAAPIFVEEAIRARTA